MTFRAKRIGLAFKRGLPPNPRWNRPAETLVQALVINGHTALLMIPGELTADLGMRIRDNTGLKHSILVTLANDAIGYITSPEEAVEGVTYAGKGSAFDHTRGQTIVFRANAIDGKTKKVLVAKDVIYFYVTIPGQPNVKLRYDRTAPGATPRFPWTGTWQVPDTQAFGTVGMRILIKSKAKRYGQFVQAPVRLARDGPAGVVLLTTSVGAFHGGAHARHGTFQLSSGRSESRHERLALGGGPHARMTGEHHGRSGRSHSSIRPATAITWCSTPRGSTRWTSGAGCAPSCLTPRPRPRWASPGHCWPNSP